MIVIDTTDKLMYASRRPVGGYEDARELLSFWMALCVLATPLGLVIGGLGTFAAVQSLIDHEQGFQWNSHSLEDWIGFTLWCINALGFVVLPLAWAILCGICRSKLRLGDVRGLIWGELLCRWALRFGVVMVVGVVFGVSKALIHRRWGETRWWIGILVGILVYGVMVEVTRRRMQYWLK